MLVIYKIIKILKVKIPQRTNLILARTKIHIYYVFGMQRRKQLNWQPDSLHILKYLLISIQYRNCYTQFRRSNTLMCNFHIRKCQSYTNKNQVDYVVRCNSDILNYNAQYYFLTFKRHDQWVLTPAG